MKKTGLFFTATLLAFMTACNRDVTEIASDLPDIRFAMHIADGTDTKALLETEDLLATGTQVKVYGFADDALQGHTSSPGSTYLNSGQTIQYGTGTWSFVDNNSEQYQWKYQQNHKFFGWLEKDAKPSTAITASGFFGGSFAFNATSKVLTVPTKAMGISPDNFDFAYSDVVIRSASSADYSTVNLPLHHLFASFGLSARNYTGTQLTITGIELHGLRDSKSATIDYSGDTVAVTYAGGSVAGPFSSSASITLAAAGNAGDTKANIVGGASESPVYFLVWPQTVSEMTYTGTKTDGKPAPTSSDTSQPYLKITYSQGGGSYTAYVEVPHDTEGTYGWGPGIRHEMELSFRDKEIDLTFQAAPWDKMEPVIDYNGAIGVGTRLHLPTEYFNNCTLSPDGKTAYFKPGIPIILEFAINTPENATWLVGKRLDWDAFDVYNYPDGARTSPDDIITAEGLIDGSTARIAIAPPTGDLQKSEYNLELTFSVRKNNGEIESIPANTIFADDCPRRFVYIRQ